MTIWLIAFPLGVLLLHAVLARRQERLVSEAWTAILRSDDQEEIDAVELMMQFDAAKIDSRLKGALAERQLGNLPEATRLLGLAFAVIEEARPDRAKRLEAMRRLIRMALAVHPVEPLQPSTFELKTLGAAAYLAELLHHLLIHPAERFLLRLRALQVGFWFAWRVASRSRLAIAAAPAGADRAWRAFAHSAHDWTCLDREHLESFKAFAWSMRAQPRAGAAAERVR
jgi:hypothetical protein